MQITPDQVHRVCAYAPASRVLGMLPHLNASLARAEVTTPLRAAMYLAQLSHESGGFAFLTELWGPTPQQLRYEPPSELAYRLGNTEPGDGSRFRGRGAIQITGRANYAHAAAALNLPLLDHPELAAQPEHAFETAALFWREHGLNRFADAGDLEGATRRINGGLTGLLERHLKYEAALDALGIPRTHAAV